MSESIHFGTDGWRAIIGEDFTNESLMRCVEASARIFAEERDSKPELAGKNTIIIGHDCRQDAHAYADLAAQVVAGLGFKVILTRDYCPTPCLCWSVAQNEDAIGGIMLTSSHNPAEYLGVKLRMADGGASPKEFTDRVEAVLSDTVPTQLGEFEECDLVTPYLAALKERVDVEAIKKAGLKVVIDPLYGAGRLYLAGLLRDLGVEVCEINNAEDPSFDGLHPEPIQPWVDRGIAKVKELGYDACFINDGDADRISAVDEQGSFVNPHRIITLLVAHLAEDKGLRGRVVSTITASAILARQCDRLGLELTSTPVGFKWIYAEMEKGDVMLGGEESGGIGIPGHVMERDGLLMALLLIETMAQKQKSLGTLVQEMRDQLGHFEFERRGLKLTDEQMDAFRSDIVPNFTPAEVAGFTVVGTDRRDGLKLHLEGDAWLMMRPSGTEPLVRVYAEASSLDDVHKLLEEASQIILR